MMRTQALIWKLAPCTPLIALVLVLASGAVAGLPAESRDAAEQQISGGARTADDPADPETAAEIPKKTIKMIASNWRWQPNVIRVPLGTLVRIEIQSYDASHSFALKAFGIKEPLPQGKPGLVEFVADKPGEFKWRCGRPCGNGCPKMVGKLIVESEDDSESE